MQNWTNNADAVAFCQQNVLRIRNQLLHIRSHSGHRRPWQSSVFLRVMSNAAFNVHCFQEQCVQAYDLGDPHTHVNNENEQRKEKQNHSTKQWTVCDQQTTKSQDSAEGEAADFAMCTVTAIKTRTEELVILKAQLLRLSHLFRDREALQVGAASGVQRQDSLVLLVSDE